jgi:hypothetical protein
MLYYCGKTGCRGHQVFSEACTASRQEQLSEKPRPYKPPRHLYQHFDLPSTKPAAHNRRRALTR